MFGEPLGAELAAIDGMIRVAAHGHRAVVLYADENAAAHGAVTASGRNPALCCARRGNPAKVRVVFVGVALGESIQADEALQVHAASLRKNGAAMFRGT